MRFWLHKMSCFGYRKGSPHPKSKRQRTNLITTHTFNITYIIVASSSNPNLNLLAAVNPLSISPSPFLCSPSLFLCSPSLDLALKLAAAEPSSSLFALSLFKY
ncbi:hypothetical protein P8452_66600 [Trifolium repens]|nr:hypothetical protein P8452_66600 [Trifolium repens]